MKDKVIVGQEVQVQVNFRDDRRVTMVIRQKSTRGLIWASPPGKEKTQQIYWHVLCQHWSIYE